MFSIIHALLLLLYVERSIACKQCVWASAFCCIPPKLQQPGQARPFIGWPGWPFGAVIYLSSNSPRSSFNCAVVILRNGGRTTSLWSVPQGEVTSLATRIHVLLRIFFRKSAQNTSKDFFSWRALGDWGLEIKLSEHCKNAIFTCTPFSLLLCSQS